MHEKKIAIKYHAELFASFAVYTVLLVLSIKYGRPMHDGVVRTLVLASPMIGFFMAIWAIARGFRRVDEYLRQLILENIAIAAAITSAVSFTYGFMETAGFPLLSMFNVWMVFGGSWGIISVARKWLGR